MNSSTETLQDAGTAPGWYEDPSLPHRRRGGFWSVVGRQVCESQTLPCVRHRALGFEFELSTNDSATAEVLTGLYSELDALGSSARASSIYVLKGSPRDQERFRVWADGSPIGSGSRFDLALSYISWLVNRGVVTHSREDLLFHAAVAAWGGEGVLLPAAMESGKTTLVAGLLACGLSYFSDEVGALDIQRLELKAYPKPLSVDPGSYGVLERLLETPGPTFGQRGARQWQVPPNVLQREAVSSRRARLSKVVFPRYEAGAPTTLTPVARAEALVMLVKNSFNFSDRPGEHLEALGKVLEDADCYQLVTGSLPEACRAVLGLFGAGGFADSLARLTDACTEGGGK